MKVTVKTIWEILRFIVRHIAKDLKEAREFLKYAWQEIKESWHDVEITRGRRFIDILRCSLGNIGFRACRERGLHEGTLLSKKACRMSHRVDRFYLIMFVVTLGSMGLLFYAFLWMPNQTHPNWFWRDMYGIWKYIYLVLVEIYVLATIFVNRHHACFRKRAGYFIFLLWIFLLITVMYIFYSGIPINEKAFDAIRGFNFISIAIFVSRIFIVAGLEYLEILDIVEYWHKRKEQNNNKKPWYHQLKRRAD